MSGAPFRERALPPDEVRRIVKRAMDLAAIDADASASMTEAELTQRLADLGVPAVIAQRAMETPLVGPAADGAIRVVREELVDGELTADHHEAIADAIGVAMKLQGRASVVGNKVSWVPGGMLTEPSVTVHSRNGRTHIRYVETLANRAQTTISFGVLSLFFAMLVGTFTSVGAVGVCKLLGITASQGGTAVLLITVLVSILAAIGGFVGLRRVLARRARTRAAFADDVIAHLATAVRAAVATRAPKLRIEAPEATSEAADEDDEAGRVARRAE